MKSRFRLFHAAEGLVQLFVRSFARSLVRYLCWCKASGNLNQDKCVASGGFVITVLGVRGDRCDEVGRGTEKCELSSRCVAGKDYET